MISNTQPIKMAYQSSLVGYTKGIFYHGSYSDEDVQGKAIWINGVRQGSDLLIDNLYFLTSSLNPSTQYTIESAFYDSMVDTELLEARLLVNIADPLVVTTKTYPTIDTISVESTNVDVGVVPPTVTMTVSGDADSIEVEWAPANTTDWNVAYVGTKEGQVQLSGLPMGTVDIRMRGVINIPDGVGTRDVSPWDIQEDVVIDWATQPPATPTAPTFTVAKLAEPSERYDVLVEWSWSQGSGPSVREFILEYIPTSLYNSNPASNRWRDSTLINTGVSQSTVINNHPFNSEHRYRVKAVSWGPTGSSAATGTEALLKITSSTPIDNDFTTQTGIEMNYAHIKGLTNDSGTWKQTFLIDAATGSVSIGLLDEHGKAPISFDPTSGNVNVDGSVISDTIIAANYVMSNLSGNDSPSIRSAGKVSYGSATDGLWMGHVADSGYKFKFDLGNASQYIRWDGYTLRISGDVVIGTPDGDIPIGEGSSYTTQIYKVSATTPSTPTDTSLPPTGWSTTPPVRTPGTQLYISVGTINKATGELIDGGAWSTPSIFSGIDGVDGKDGKDGTDGIDGKDGTNGIDGKDGLPGADGVDGLDGDTGIPGADGTSSYFHIAYADDDVGTGFTQTPGDKEYMGTYVDSNPIDSTDPTDYDWTKIQGAQGADGTDGIPGVDGEDGQTSYLHIAYADTSSGGGFSQSPTNKSYLGQYVDFNPTDSNNPALYTWSLIKGEDGIPGSDGAPGLDGTDGIDGAPGEDGRTSYFHIAYADDANGNGFSQSPAGKPFMGTYSDFNPTDSSNPSSYAWSEIKGQDGTDGIPGDNGEDGQTSYLHIAYADTSSGGGFSQSPTGKDYIGQYVDFNPTDSSNPALYTWSLIKGADGQDGTDGSNGQDGDTVAEQYRYNSNATSSGATSWGGDPRGTDYYRQARTLTNGSQTAIGNWHVWRKDGEDGQDGAPGQDGQDGGPGLRAPNFYSQGLAGFSSWNQSQATALFETLYGSGEGPVVYDVLTQFNTANPDIFETRMWNGSAWTTSTLGIHGNAVISGTLRADTLVASSAFLQDVGVDVIYDNGAFVNGTPEVDYGMKIDLANGSIHIK